MNPQHLRICVVCCVVSLPWVCNAAPIQGDAELLRQIHAALLTNEAQFERGAMRLHATGSGTLEADLEVEFVWDRNGDRRYWKSSGTATNRIDSVECIRVPDSLITFNPRSRFVRRTSRRRSMEGIPIYMQLHPAERWFVFDMGQHRLSEMIDPDAATPGLSYVVRQDGEAVVIERHLDGQKAYTFTASLAHGGNIVHVETSPEWAESASAYVRNADYEWAPDGAGGWSPRSLWLRHSHPDDPDTHFWSLRVDVMEHEANPTIRPDRFEMSSLAAPDGTRVSVIDAAGEKVRAWRIGGDDRPRPADAELDELGEFLRRNGFADPERKQ